MGNIWAAKEVSKGTRKEMVCAKKNIEKCMMDKKKG